MSSDLQNEVEQVVQELREKAEEEGDKLPSLFKSSQACLARKEAYNDAADMLEDRFL
jgi:hypothetical protein